jgi:hypothetical protein
MADILFQALLFPQGTGSNPEKNQVRWKKNRAMKACIMVALQAVFQKERLCVELLLMLGFALFCVGVKLGSYFKESTLDKVV